MKILNSNEEKTIVFCETKVRVNQLYDDIKQLESVAAIHGDKTQQQRENILKSFRDNQVRVLVATDVASRGLDISDVMQVINYDMPF